MMIRTIGTADRKTLEQNLKRLKLRHVRDSLDAINEVALAEASWLSWYKRRSPGGKPPKGNGV